MDKTILNGSKLRVYDLGNSQSGSIQYTLSRLKITGNNSGSGVLITDGKLHLKSGNSTTSMAYVSSSNPGVSFNSGRIYLGTGSNTSSIYNDNGNVHIDSGITVSNLNIEYTEGVAANILGRVQFGSGLATGDYSHALGDSTQATGGYSHALGTDTQATGYSSHALGYRTQASGAGSHALGSGSVATGYFSHALGLGTTTSISYQHATGKYNAVDNNAIFIVGTGSSEGSRANGFWVTLTGLANAGLGFSSSGYLKIGGQSTMSNVLVQNRLQVGKYHQLIGEDYTEFVIHSAPQGGNVIRIDGSEQSILIDEVNAFNVGIGMSLPQYKLDVNGVIRSSEGFTSSGYLKIGGQSTLSNLLVNLCITTSNILVKDKLYITGSSGTASMHMNAQSRLLISNTIYGKSGLYVDGQMTGNQGLYVFDNADPIIMAYFDGIYATVDIGNNALNPSQIIIGNQILGSFTEIPSELYIGNNAYFASLLQNNDDFVSGFGGSGWQISQANKSIAQFDDLWVRGSMNVYEMVINQIRSTNGSLWISDASKATSASYSSATNTLILSFLTGSLVPFIAGDILRSKRWGLSGSTTQSQWDITTTVSSVNYASGYVTLSAPTINNLYTVTGSANGTWTQLAERLSNSGSLWVRVGNTTTESNRDGSIYITSNDLGGPFLDVYDNVTSSILATGGNSSGVDNSKTKVRLGNLNGITDPVLGTLAGYGLYSDNVYLKGAINAQRGEIAGWSIYPQQLQYVLLDVKEVNLSPDGLSFVDLTTNDSLYIGYSYYMNGFGVFCGNLFLTLNPKFKVDNLGAYLSGSIIASAGYIGGWNILNTELSSGDDWTTKTILSPNSLIFSDLSQGAAIIIGTHSQLSSYGIVCGYPTGDPSDLYIDPIYFKVDVGGAYLQGEVLAESGNIGGWDIATTNISKGNIILSATDNHQSLLISSTDYTTSNGVYLGSSSTFGTRMSVMNGSNKFLFDGTNIGISTSKFTLSQGVITAQDAIISGSIQANTGYIGGASGWSITTNKITSSNGILFSNSSTPAIKIGAASYGSNGIWLGKGDYYSASFWNTTTARGLKWDGLKVIISASNFNLDTNGKISANLAVISGTITSSAGQIGGWTINSGGISSVHSYGTVSITRSGISNLSLTDTYGNFTYSAANSNLYISSVNKYLVDSASTVTDFNRYESGITISQANPNQGFGVLIDHLFNGIVPLFVFTVSGLTIDKEYILQSKLENLTVSGFGTPVLADHSSIYCWITPTTDPWYQEVIWGDNPLWSKGSPESNNLVKQYRMTPISETTYLWVGGTITPGDLLFSKVVKFTFSGFRIDSFKQYTELSLKGLLVFNSPENYLQLSSENDYLTNSSKGSLGLLNVTELHVNGTSINDRINNPISVFNGGTGTNSFAHRQFLWYDSESKMITASGFSSSSGGGSGMTDYSGPALTGNRVISQIAISSGVMTTASRALTAVDISAVATSRKVEGTGLLSGGGNLTADRTITHNIANGAYHLPVNGSAGQLIMYSGTAGSGSWTSDIQTTGTASFASITASAGFTSSTGNIAIGGSITSSLAVKAKYFDAHPDYGYQFYGTGSIKVDPVHGTALDLQEFSSLKIGNNNDLGTSDYTFLQGTENTARGNVIHMLGYSNQAIGECIHIEGAYNRAEVSYGHTLGYFALGHITGSKTFANGSMDGQFPSSTTQVSTIVLYAYGLYYDTCPLINLFYLTGEIDFNRVGLIIDKLHISFFLNVMITYQLSTSTYAYLQTFTYHYDDTYRTINTGEPYGDVSATVGIRPVDLGELVLVLRGAGEIQFLYTPSRNFEINSVIVKVEMIEHIVYKT